MRRWTIFSLVGFVLCTLALIETRIAYYILPEAAQNRLLPRLASALGGEKKLIRLFERQGFTIVAATDTDISPKQAVSPLLPCTLDVKKMFEHKACLDREYAALTDQLGVDPARHATFARHTGIVLAFPFTLVCVRATDFVWIAKDGHVLKTNARIYWICV